MTNHVKDAWRTLAPANEPKHGPLPPFLVLLTLVTGLVDAYSYLAIGHVFVANMTGNVVFLAFGIAGIPGFSLWASALALVAFSVGAVIGGRIIHSLTHHRGRALLAGAIVELALMVAASIVSFASGSLSLTAAHAILISLLGVALGVQNAVVRALAVPDLTTTVLTLTIAGISADSQLAGGENSKAGRRLVSVVSMFIGALIGALLSHAGLAGISLVIASIILLTVVLASIRIARSTESWISS